jgi:hypothetical protein
MVAAGFGVSVVPESIQQIHAEGVAYLRIQGNAPRAAISLAYRRHDHAAIVRNFVALAKRAGYAVSNHVAGCPSVVDRPDLPQITYKERPAAAAPIAMCQ